MSMALAYQFVDARKAKKKRDQRTYRQYKHHADGSRQSPINRLKRLNIDKFSNEHASPAPENRWGDEEPKGEDKGDNGCTDDAGCGHRHENGPESSKSRRAHAACRQQYPPINMAHGGCQRQNGEWY